MKKLVKIKNTASIILDDGTLIITDSFTDEDTIFCLQSSDDEIKDKYIVGIEGYLSKSKEIKKTIKEVQKSSNLVFNNGKVTIPSISEVSVPKLLVEAISLAEKNKDENKLQGYLNFWTLACKNPNEEARNNLLWFLETHKFKILKSGLFVTYRNVVSKNTTTVSSDVLSKIKEKYKNIKTVQKKSPKKYSVVFTTKNNFIIKKSVDLTEDELKNSKNLYEFVNSTPTIFTDKYTKTMKIELGVPVRIPREACDEDSKVSCSRGLHLAKKDWRDLGMFGDTTIMCLCNPMNVVAVPKEQTYGKLRTCEYFPLKVVHKDKNNNIIETIEDGDELDYFNISYDGVINNKKSSEFVLELPKEPRYNIDNILANLNSIKKELENKSIKA